MRPTSVIKRDGQQVPFEHQRIAHAIARAQHAVGIDDAALADELARVVVEHLERACDQASLGIVAHISQARSREMRVERHVGLSRLQHPHDRTD